MITERKYCQKCKRLDELHLLKTFTSKAGNTFKYYICRGCRAKQQSKWYEKNKDKQIEYNRRYLERKNAVN